jgi:hypothetical protein
MGAHGNVRFLANSAGSVTDTYTFDAFGAQIASSGTTDFDTLKWPHFDHYIWPTLTDRSAYPVCEADGEGDGKMDTVKSVGFYHGGDVLYELSEISGTWHEACLESPT